VEDDLRGDQRARRNQNHYEQAKKICRERHGELFLLDLNFGRALVGAKLYPECAQAQEPIATGAISKE